MRPTNRGTNTKSPRDIDIGIDQTRFFWSLERICHIVHSFISENFASLDSMMWPLPYSTFMPKAAYLCNYIQPSSPVDASVPVSWFFWSIKGKPLPLERRSGKHGYLCRHLLFRSIIVTKRYFALLVLKLCSGCRYIVLVTRLCNRWCRFMI